MVRFMRCHISVQKLWRYNSFWNLCLSLKKTTFFSPDPRERTWLQVTRRMQRFSFNVQVHGTVDFHWMEFSTNFFYQNVQLDMCQKVKMEAQTTKQWASPDSICYNSKTLMRLRKRSDNHWWCCANRLTKVRALFSSYPKTCWNLLSKLPFTSLKSWNIAPIIQLDQFRMWGYNWWIK